jgi:hypothetical protein
MEDKKMMEVITSRILRIIPLLVAVCLFSLPAYAKYGGGTGETTTEMQTSSTFLKTGWDFMDETANGTEDIWWILEGQEHFLPRPRGCRVGGKSLMIDAGFSAFFL